MSTDRSRPQAQTGSTGQTPGAQGIDPSLKRPEVPDHVMERCIGSGAYGAVWLARNIMGTYRAVKVVYRENFPDDGPYEREFRGIRAFEPVSRTHGALIDILQVGRDDEQGFFYYVMELADDQSCGSTIEPETYQARSLASEIDARGRLPPEECLELITTLTEGLHHLHEEGLVHRDIKPSNIVFINGIPKIADIGLVTPARDDVSLVGTEGYFLPGEIGTPQGDIYALGKVLYETTSGNSASAYPELPQEFQPNTGNLFYSELNAIVLKACELNPAARYRDVAALRSDLHLLRAGRSVKRLHALETQLAKARRAVLILITVGLVGLVVYYTVAEEAKRQAERVQRQVGQYVERGTRHMDQLDFMGALAWFAAALELDEGHPDAERTHRVRLETTLRECPLPASMWFESRQTTAGELHAESHSWAVGDNTGKLRWVGYGATNDWVGEFTLRDSRSATNGLEIEDIVFSRDGGMLAACGQAQAAVWLRGELEPAHQFSHDYTVYGLALSPNGRTLVTCSGDDKHGEVWVRDLVTGSSNRLATATGAFRSAGFSPNAERLVVAGEGGVSQIYDVRTLRPEQPPFVHPPRTWIYDAEFSPDGTMLVTAADDGLARIYDLESGQLKQTLRHPAVVRMARFSPDGRLLLTASWDYSARVWRVSDGTLAYRPLKQSGKHLRYAGFASGGWEVLTVNGNGVVCLWDLPLAVQGRVDTYSWFAPLSRTGVELLDDQVWLFHELGRQKGQPILEDAAQANLAVFDESGAFLLLASAPTLTVGQNHARRARLWDVTRKVFVGQPFDLVHKEPDEGKEAQGILQNVAVSAQGGQVATAARMNSDAWQVALWDAANNGWVRPPLLLTNEVHELRFSPNGLRLAILARNDAILIDLAPGGGLRTFPHPDPVEHVAFSHDDQRIITCRSDGTLFERTAQVWDLQTGQKLTVELPHGDGVKFAEFSSNDSRIVTASEDNLVRVWDSSEGSVVCEVAHRSEVYVARFSRNDRWILTGGRDRRARVWDAETGDPVTPWFEHDSEVVDARFLDDDTSVWTWGGQGQNTLWSLTPAQLTVDQLTTLAEVLSGRQVVRTRAVLLRRPKDLWERWLAIQPTELAPDSSGDAALLAWHQRAAALSLKEGNEFATRVHQEWLQRLEDRAE